MGATNEQSRTAHQGHSQHHREGGIARIIETGTYLGTTTAFFAEFGVPVITAERDPDLARDAAKRLQNWSNVEVRGDDSVRVLQQLVREPIDRSVPTFFYLDAHAQKHLPVREETELAIAYFPRAIVMIDDFQVPDDPEYGFGERRLSLGYLLQGSLRQLTVFFPSARALTETGARRGCVVLTADPAAASILGKLRGLRRWLMR